MVKFGIIFKDYYSIYWFNLQVNIIKILNQKIRDFIIIYPLIRKTCREAFSSESSWLL